MIPILSLVLILCITYLGILCVRTFKLRRVLNKIPSPPGHWLIGNAIWLLNNSPENIFGLLRECADKYWPIYRFSSPYIVTVNILHPADFELILSPMKHLTKSRIYKFLHSWLGEGLLTSNDGKWQKRRKILTPAFHFSILQQFLKIFSEETDNLCERIEKLCEGNNSAVIDVIPLVTNMTLQSIIETSMGISNKDEVSKQEYKNCIYKMCQLLTSRITKPWLRFSLIFAVSKEGKEEKKTVKTLRDFTYKIIKDRENVILSQDMNTYGEVSYSGRKILRMLDILLMAKIKEGSIDIEGIREEVDTFTFGGHDTTTAAICFLLLTLANEPKIQQEVKIEIEGIMGKDKTAPSYQDLQNMTYTERVIKECLRLYPSVPFISRIASEDFTTHTGYQIPKGTILNLQIFDLHRNSRIYPDPLKFDPDRFLLENTKNRHPFAYMPFSAGPRNCIGQKFALLEIKSAICGILRKFELHPVDKPKDIELCQDLVLRSRVPVRVKFVRR